MVWTSRATLSMATERLTGTAMGPLCRWLTCQIYQDVLIRAMDSYGMLWRFSVENEWTWCDQLNFGKHAWNSGDILLVSSGWDTVTRRRSLAVWRLEPTSPAPCVTWQKEAINKWRTYLTFVETWRCLVSFAHLLVEFVGGLLLKSSCGSWVFTEIDSLAWCLHIMNIYLIY